ncbi:MAG: enoyl-CoA hydratase, partial [Lachnospiraceae bacterium]|nr:enoyl-CoA hydratase [Lachnospiraceae bacterium]
LEELLPTAEKLASTIAKNAPIAVRACKKAINEGLELNMDDAIALEEKIFGDCFETEDQREGMANFLRKKDDPEKKKIVDFKNR